MVQKNIHYQVKLRWWESVPKERDGPSVEGGLCMEGGLSLQVVFMEGGLSL